MALSRAYWRFDRLDALEGRWCRPLNIVARNPLAHGYFKLVSRLGDGIAWYATLCVLPLIFGRDALSPTLAIALTGLTGLVLYKFMKTTLVRERPFASHSHVHATTVPLDKHSFPSGHAMHATAFIVQLGHYFPGLMPVMLPFAVSVALSRVVLGLHYPSDVVAGIFVGWLLAAISLNVAGGFGL